jgi:ABC-2 type transport system permease protein
VVQLAQAGHRSPSPLGPMTLRELITLYCRLVWARIRGEMQYKVSFLLRTIGSFGVTIIDFAAIAVLFSRIPHLSGWSLLEVALLYGLASTCFATAELFAAALDDFDTFIVQGTFDRVLARPLGALFQTMTEEMSLRRLGRVAQGLFVLGLAIHLLSISWTFDRVLVLLVALVSGIAVFFGIFVLSAAYCFWVVQGKEATHIVTYGGDYMSSYPLDIYHRWLRHFATFVLPVGFVSYYPSLYILGRQDPFGSPDWMRLASPVAAALVCFFAWWAWSAGIRRYQSTGS